MKPYLLLYAMGGFLIGFGSASTFNNHGFVGAISLLSGIVIWMLGYMEHST